MAAQFGCYPRYANALPGEPDQASDFLLGPLFWLRCFHGAALRTCRPLNQRAWLPTLGKFTGGAFHHEAQRYGGFSARETGVMRRPEELYWGSDRRTDSWRRGRKQVRYEG